LVLPNKLQKEEPEMRTTKFHSRAIACKRRIPIEKQYSKKGGELNQHPEYTTR
jgi:hypothetical protein